MVGFLGGLWLLLGPGSPGPGGPAAPAEKRLRTSARGERRFPRTPRRPCMLPSRGPPRRPPASAPSDLLSRPAALSEKHSHCNRLPGHPEFILDAPSAQHIQERPCHETQIFCPAPRSFHHFDCGELRLRGLDGQRPGPFSPGREPEPVPDIGTDRWRPDDRLSRRGTRPLRTYFPVRPSREAVRRRRCRR